VLTPTPPSLVSRALNRARGTWHDGQARGRVTAARLVRGARLGAVAAGLAAPEVAVLECRAGRDVSGFFSEFAAVVGLLDHFERWRHLHAGVRVNFPHGLYFDAAVGPNWWEYYFESIDVRDRSDSPSRVVSPHYHDLCANRVERTIPRPIGAALVERYVVVRPSIQDLVDAFIRDNWADRYIVGLHYRGTDKSDDAPRVPYERVESAVRDAMAGRDPDRCQLFLATDEQPFLAFMQASFPAQLSYRQMFRSVDGRPIDVVNPEGNYKKGLDAVVDCLLLSRATTLIRTASNLSLCSTLFSPALPDMLMNPER